jgi:hypothetical protein
MTVFGTVNTINASPVVDKVQNVQQTQVEVNQTHTDEKALHDREVRRKTVNKSPEGEKARLREREKKGNKQKGSEEKESESKERQKTRRIHLTV